MRIIRTNIEDVVLLEPRVFTDCRGYFFESFSSRNFEAEFPGIHFVQDNESCSKYGVLRGLHYQTAEFAQAKLVRVIHGHALDVAVDMRKNSPTFKHYTAHHLSAENKWQMFIPKGFAHGFVALSEEVILQYKCDAFYSPPHEGGIRYDDPALNINWEIPAEDIILSGKDMELPYLENAFLF